MSSKTNVRRRERAAGDNVVTKRPRTRSQAMKIIAVNDDCLMEIFSYLSLEDLCAVKKSHPRFIESANYVFKETHWDRDTFYKIWQEDKYRYEPVEVTTLFGDVIQNVILELVKYRTNEEHRKYFSLLNHCSAMEKLIIDGCHLEQIATDLMEIKSLRNLNSLSVSYFSGSVDILKLFLNACDPLKLCSLRIRKNFDVAMTDDLLAFVAERMVNLNDLGIDLWGWTPLFLDNLSKLRNLTKLKDISVLCREMLLITPLIDALAKIDSLQTIVIEDLSWMVLDVNIVRAINNLSNVRRLSYSTKREFPDIEKITGFQKISYDDCRRMWPNEYVFER